MPLIQWISQLLRRRHDGSSIAALAGGTASGSAVDPVGTTLTALQTGSGRFQLTLTIEGYPNVVTDGPTAPAIAAYAGTDFTTAIGGLCLELQNQQRLNPWRSIGNGGTLVAKIVPVANVDTFGADTAKMNFGGETVLTVGLDRDDTTITVKDTSTFPAAPSSIYIGNECIGYSAKTATTFTASPRGKYSPLARGTGTEQFAEDHRVGNYDFNINLEPVVSQYRRIWRGAWVCLRLHRISNPLLGTIDTKAESQIIFAGTLDQITHDPAQGCTTVSCVNVMERVRSAILLRDQYKATLKPGMYISGLSVNASDNNGTTLKTANALNIATGYYTADQLLSKSAAWLASEKVAGRLSADYTLVIEPGNIGTCTKLRVRFVGVGATTTVKATIVWPRPIAIFLGWQDTSTSGQTSWTQHVTTIGSAQTTTQSAYHPKMVFLGVDQGTTTRVQLDQQVGTAVDQFASLPPMFGVINNAGYTTVCVFQLADGSLFVGAISAGTELIVLPGTADLSKFVVDYDLNAPPAPIEIKQIIAYTERAKTFLATLFYSTGTAGYNDATYDIAAIGFGLGIPGAVLGDAFESSLTNAVLGDVMLTTWITKPTKLIELLDNDLILLGLYLVWKNQSLRFVEWAMPTAALSVLALTEANKSEQVGTATAASHLAPTVLSSEWVKPIIKIEHDYDQITGEYRSRDWLVDRTAVDDASADAADATIHARNIAEGDYALVRDNFKTRLGFFTRDMHRTHRSLSLAHFEGVSVGDNITLTDKMVRDPVTGLPGTVARPGLIISHTYDPGGANPKGGKRRGFSGEVEVLMAPVNRASVWSPCAMVDETVSGGGFAGGYNAGTKTLRTKAHEHSESTDAVDASRFPALSKVRVTEIDPPDPAAPLTWTDTVVSQSGNDIVLTTGLAGFVSTKKYRVVSDTYSVATTTQKSDCYQADDADGLIENAAAAYRYELAQMTPYSTETIAKRAEFIPTNSYGDGKPLDTGHARGIIRSINQLIDYKTAHQSPMLMGVAGNASYAGYLLRFTRRIYVGRMLPGYVTRYISVAPFFRSASGAAVNCRVTLCRNRPAGDSLDVSLSRPPPYSEAIFTTPATTNWGTPAAQDLDLQVIGAGGWAYLLIELAQNCECRGFGKLIEGVRQ